MNNFGAFFNITLVNKSSHYCTRRYQLTYYINLRNIKEFFEYVNIEQLLLNIFGSSLPRPLRLLVYMLRLRDHTVYSTSFRSLPSDPLLPILHWELGMTNRCLVIGRWSWDEGSRW
jgi:hypothetical protein